METKFCNKCKQEKPISEFYKSTRGGCKKCIRIYQNKYRREHQVLKRQPDPEGFRTCSKCKELKPVTEFYRDRSNVSGYAHRCKKCSDKIRKERRVKEKESNQLYTVELPEGYKLCKKCNTIYPLSEFYKSPNGKYWSPCKYCKNEYKQTEKYKKQQKKYYRRKDAREKVRARKKRYRAKSETQAKEKEYRVKYGQREYVKKKNKIHNRDYRSLLENQEKARQRTIEWRRENHEKANHHSRVKRARKREAEGSHTVEQWETLVSFFDCCPRCGEDEPLTCDHIIPLNKGGSDWITNLQPLCLRCNTAKRDYFVKDYRPPEVRAWAEKEKAGMKQA